MYELYEDAASFSIGGLTIYAYGLFLALGAALALLTLRLTAKKRGLPLETAALYGALALPLGFALARAAYCLLDTGFSTVASMRSVFLFTGGGYAMCGALLGGFFAAFFTAKILKQDSLSLLDAVAPALLVFILFERVGESFTTLGVSRSLVDGTLKDTFLAQSDTYDAYLRTWLMEAIGAGALLIVSLRLLRGEKRRGDTFFKTALLFGAFQVLFESLRYDQHLKYGFVGAQHILSMLLMCAVVILFAVRALKAGAKKTLPVVSICILPALAALLVALEFMIDRTSVSRYLLYLVYALLLCAPVILGFKLEKKGAVQ